jgi:hypothetical protein
MEHPCTTPEERAELQERFEAWLKRQERQLERGEAIGG